MIPGGIILLWIGMFTFGGLMFLFQYSNRKKREVKLAALADEKGWTYTSQIPALEKTYQGFRPFGTGSSRRCRHVVKGKVNGRNFVLFQYQYTVSTGKSSSTYYHRILDAEAPLDGRGLRIEKEGIHHKIGDALGGEDIDFESDQFSKRYWVKCSDRAFAYAVISPAMIDFLMGHQPQIWQWYGKRLLLIQKGRLDPANVLPMTDLASGFLDNLPRHLLHEASQEAGA